MAVSEPGLHSETLSQKPGEHFTTTTKKYTKRPTQFRVGFCYILVFKGMRMRRSKISILVASLPWCHGCFPISFTTEPGAKFTCGVVGDNI